MVHYAKFMEWHRLYPSCTRIYVLIIPAIGFALRILAACRRSPREDVQSRDAQLWQVDHSPMCDLPPAAHMFRLVMGRIEEDGTLCDHMGVLC